MIHEISTTEFIAAVIDGSYNENDVQRYCVAQPSLMPLFKSLYKEASTLIASKECKGNCVWNLTDRRFDFDNPKDLRLYTDAGFTRLQSAMGIVCDLMDKQQPKAVEDYILKGDKPKVIEAIRSLVQGKKGKEPAMYIAIAISSGYLSSNIKFPQIQKFFGVEGSKQGFNSYLSKFRYEIENMPKYRNDYTTAKQVLLSAINGEK